MTFCDKAGEFNFPLQLSFILFLSAKQKRVNSFCAKRVVADRKVAVLDERIRHAVKVDQRHSSKFPAKDTAVLLLGTGLSGVMLWIIGGKRQSEI